MLSAATRCIRFSFFWNSISVCKPLKSYLVVTSFCVLLMALSTSWAFISLTMSNDGMILNKFVQCFNDAKIQLKNLVLGSFNFFFDDKFIKIDYMYNGDHKDCIKGISW